MGRAEDIFEKIKKEDQTAINDFILTRKSEELFLDFKRSADDGSGIILNQKDRNNLAKAISGFGNSEGGVVVWGVACSMDRYDSADIASTKHPIKDVKRFVSWLNGAISGCTIPPHSKVQNLPISINDNDEGFVITYVPKSDTAPHQVVGELQYYMRAGSSFSPISHGVLAGMFGRRPQPHVFPMFTIGTAKVVSDVIRMQIGFMIANNGPGIASDLFINVIIISHPGDNCQLSLDPMQSTNWEGQFAFGRILNMISKEGVRLAPGAFVQPCTITLLLAPPFKEDLNIEVTCGCGQSPSYKFNRGSDKGIIERVYKEFLQKNRNGLVTKDDFHDITRKIFGLEKEEIDGNIES